MHILVTGGHGFLGSATIAYLSKKGHDVTLLRRRSPMQVGVGSAWDPEAGQIYLEPDSPLDAVVHFAGENIARRWTRAAKRNIFMSRVEGTQLLCEALATRKNPPKVVICASATGLYGDRAEELLQEDSAFGQGFLPGVCRAWEEAAEPARKQGIRVVHLRLGIVLGKQGGVLHRMLPAFRWGLGGRMGSGQQYWSWIALKDVLRIVEFVLHHEDLRGPVNVVSPCAVTNAEFTKTLAKILHRPSFLSIPTFVIKAIFGQMADEALLASTRVYPMRLLDAGFHFRFSQIVDALEDVLLQQRT